MKKHYLVRCNFPFIQIISLSRACLHVSLASIFVFSLSMMASTASHALTPTQQAVMNYFTNPSLCRPVTLEEDAEEPIDEKKKGELSGFGTSNKIFRSEFPDPLAVTDGAYECSNLRTADGEIHFQAGIERLLNSPESLNLEEVLLGLAFEEVITMGTLNVEINGAHMANLNAHVDDLHQGSIGMRHPSVSAKDLSQSKQTGGGASSSGSDNNKIGFFFNTRVDTGDKDVSPQETGFDFDAYGITGGMDVRVNNNLVVGFAAGYGNTQADYTSSIGSMEMDGYSLSAFGTLYKKDKYFLDAIVNYTRNEFESSRTFVTPNNITQTALGETDGDTLTIGLGMGYEEHIKDVTFGPFIRLNYTKVDIDAFSETGAGLVSLQIDEQQLKSFEGVVGFQASKIISRPWGVLIPQFRLELVHEFKNESRIINARFQGAVNNGITTNMLIPTDMT